MAKQLVGPFERHIDKGVLGLTALLLVAVIAMYGVTTPNQVEFGREPVKPGAIDATLKTKADSVVNQIARKKPEPEEYQPRSESFDQLLETYAAAGLPKTLPRGVSFLPTASLVGPPVPIDGWVELPKVVRLPKPKVVVGRSIVQQPIPTGTPDSMIAGFQQQLNWATVTSNFDREEMERREAAAYPAPQGVIFAGTELQRRMMRDDGTWSDEEWKTINTWTNAESDDPLSQALEPPQITLMDIDGTLAAPAADRAAVQDYERYLAKPQTQLSILRPLPPDTVSGDLWRVPITTNRRDVLAMDDEYQNPESPPTDDLSSQDRYPDKDLVVSAPTTAAQSIDDINKARWSKYRELARQAEEETSRDLAVLAKNILVEIIQDSRSSRADKQRAKEMAEGEAADRIRQIQRDLVLKMRQEQLAGGHAKRDSREEQYVRPKLPQQQVWAINAEYNPSSPDYLEGGRTYQYRMRVLLFNHLAGRPSSMKNSDDAKVVRFGGEWSEASDPVYVETAYRFFVTNTRGSGDGVKVKLAMYKWVEGYWVSTTQNFTLGESLSVQDEPEVPLMSFSGRELQKIAVHFDTPASLLGVSDDETVLLPGRSGRFDLDKESVVAFVDNRGHVFERIAALDKMNSEYRATQDEVFDPKSMKKEEPDRPKPMPGGPGGKRGPGRDRPRGKSTGKGGP